MDVALEEAIAWIFIIMATFKKISTRDKQMDASLLYLSTN